jgi:amidohydrolase
LTTALDEGATEADRFWAQVPCGAEPLPGKLEAWLADAAGELVTLRRHLHAHPELSGREFQTAGFIAHELETMGLEPRLLPKGNGVLCDIGTGERVVALRADIDALALPDVKAVPYRSKVEGVCHACGHDVQTPVLLGVARALSQLESDGLLPGRVRLIFQPSEEAIPSGAPEVIAADGLADVAAIFALHCYPQRRSGAVRPGPLTAATDTVDIRVTWPGGHTARPHLTADLLHGLARVISEVPTRLNRKLDPRSSATMVFGAVHAGEAHNTIPMEGHVRGTVRVLRLDTWYQLPEMIEEIVADVLAGTGVAAEVDYRQGVPPVVNDRTATAVVAKAAATALGAAAVGEAEISMGGEDFAFYAEKVPASMFRLGVGRPEATEALDIHQSAFDVDERAIAVGVRVFVHTVLQAFAA